jgi:lysophospholipase L1-like esterase
VTPILSRRAGIPRFAGRVRAGQAATIVAFGTSQTLAGAYLEHIPAALRAANGDARVALINRGRNGYMTLGAAFRVADDVLPHAPDLVLIEFAHNDVTDVLVDYVPRALEGIIGQIRRAFPECEFVFVYLALPGSAEGGPTPAMIAYEAVADYYGIPSIDLATLSEELVASRRAVWYGEEGRALTIDGIHHTPAAAGFLGEPFAGAFSELLAPGGDAAPVPAPHAGAMMSVARVRAAQYLSTGVWEVRPLRAAELRGAGIDEEGLAEAREPGASLRIGFTGTNAFAWVSGSGVIGVHVIETDARFRVGVDAVAKWWLGSLMETLPLAHYTLELIALNAGLLIGDIGLIGTLG